MSSLLIFDCPDIPFSEYYVRHAPHYRHEAYILHVIWEAKHTFKKTFLIKPIRQCE